MSVQNFCPNCGHNLKGEVVRPVKRRGAMSPSKPAANGSCGCGCGTYPDVSHRNRKTVIKGDGAIITTGNGQSTIIDAEDLELTKNKVIKIKRSPDGKFMARAYDRDKKTYVGLHRFLMGVTDHDVWVIHTNGNKLDNRKRNLRIVANLANEYERALENSI